MDKLVNSRNTVAFLDLVVVIISFACANLLRFGNSGMNTEHSQMLFAILICAYLIDFVFFQEHKRAQYMDIGERAKAVITCNLRMLVITLAALFAFHIGIMQSRFVVGIFFVLDTGLMLAVRTLWKYLLLNYFKKPEKRQKLVVFTNEENCLEALNRLNRHVIFSHDIVAIIVMGEEAPIHYYQVKHRKDKRQSTYLEERQGDIMDFLTKAVVDEAMLNLPDANRRTVETLIETLESMGITVHLSISTFNISKLPKEVGSFGLDEVLKFYEREFTPGELFLKRFLDIVIGFIGCVFCVIVGIFVCPAIYLEDPGPVLFKQKRVGRNGRYFYIYKFRSMYQDAEARKKELMEKNEMQGLMFKMKDDPRITKVGKFIRKTSLDEFPQFFNVLAGQMSICGTRPPTVDEFEQYSAHHKRRLQLKPGITGLWQVSGRSDIQDFDEVVRLDCQYIDEQSLWLDIKILFQTVKVVLMRKGSS
ncbi:MAG: sugar transferase [Eubacteriales bacterium]|nr:sugar transferase [Eubacteriales bacterium]